MKLFNKVVTSLKSLFYGLFPLLLLSGCMGDNDPQKKDSAPAKVDYSSRKNISSDELQAALSQGEKILLLDVRSEGEYQSGYIADAVNISYDKVIRAPHEVPDKGEKLIVIYCESGYRSKKAQVALQEAQYPNVLHLAGDMREWRRKGLPVKQKTP